MAFKLTTMKYTEFKIPKKENLFSPFLIPNYNYIPKDVYIDFSYSTLIENLQTRTELFESLDIGFENFGLITGADVRPNEDFTILKSDNFFDEFRYLRRSSFIDFFIVNMIDVPICFKKSKSLKMKNFELPVLKFSNFLMRKGEKEKTLIFLFKALRQLSQELNKENKFLKLQICSYFGTFNFLNSYLYLNSPRITKNFNPDIHINLLNAIFPQINERELNFKYFFKYFLIDLLSKVSPIFSFFIYNVDKNIRKFSRGRSGKYAFVWKYVAPYKRLNLAMRWIAKDIKFFQSKTFTERLVSVLSTLATSPENGLAYKFKNFSHNYVFKNFKKSLMSSLKTTS